MESAAPCRVESLRELLIVRRRPVDRRDRLIVYRRLRWMRSVSRDESADHARNVSSTDPICRTSPSISGCAVAIGV